MELLPNQLFPESCSIAVDTSSDVSLTGEAGSLLEMSRASPCREYALAPHRSFFFFAKLQLRC